MRFNQITEAPTVTAQDVYDAVVKTVGRLRLKTKRYSVSRAEMQEVKKLLPGVRVLPKEVRAVESYGYYKLDTIPGIDLAAPRVPVNPYEKENGFYINDEYAKYVEAKEAIIAGTFKGETASIAPVAAPVAPKSPVVPPVVKPVAPVSAAKPSPSRAVTTIESVVDSLFYEARKHFTGRWIDLRKEDDGFSVRDWGTWEVPEGEEDDGDYDWEVLTRDSQKKLKVIFDQLDATIPPGWKLDYQISEKNWIYFTVRKA